MAANATEELRNSVLAALETYSNVHRGSGHYSQATVFLYHKAGEIVLEYLKLRNGPYTVIFLSPARAGAFKTQLRPGCFHCISSKDIGLPLGVCALAVKRTKLPKVPLETGGGTARLVSSDWVVWSGAPERFEAGTPAIINVIAFARALQLTVKYGKEIFGHRSNEKLTASEILYKDELSGLSGKELLEKYRQMPVMHKGKVPAAGGEKAFINLDNGASTPTFVPVWKAFSETLFRNSDLQQEVIGEVKTICSGFLGAPLSEYEMVFVSNTTEAINLVAKNISKNLPQNEDFVVLNTYLEHNSNDLPWRMTDGITLLRFPADDEGFLDLRELETVLRDYNERSIYGKKRIKLLSVSGASNVLGTFNDLAEISRIAHCYGARLLVDAAQLVAHRSVDMYKTGIDYLAFSAHKAYAPFGSGLLAARKELLNFTPAELEYYKASGEENAGGIAALGKSLSILQRIGMELIEQEERTLTIQALKGFSAVPGLKVFGLKGPESPGFDRKGGVIVFSVKGIMPDVLARKLAEQGAIGVRYGCHCSHLLVKRLLRVSPTLEKLQGVIARTFPKVNFPGLTRISIGIENSSDDIETFIDILKAIVNNPRSPVTGVKSRIDVFVSGIAAKVFE